VTGEESWERWENAMMRVIPLPLLAISTLVTFLQPSPSTGYLLTTLAIVGATFAWVLALDTLNPAWETDHQSLSVVYYLGLLAFVAVLIVRAPWYGVFGFSGYLRAFKCLPGTWRYVGLGATAFLMAVSQIGGVGGISSAGWPSFLLLVFLNIGLAGAFSFFAARTIERDEKRRQTLEELAESNAQLAAALEENAGLHAQLLVQAREAGVTDERQRMAREIHDTLAQGLTGIITQLEAAEQAKQNPVEWQRHLDNATALARESLTEARRSVHAIRPEALEKARLPEALGDVITRWSDVNGVAAELTTTGTAVAMHPDIEVTLLRVAQEALANVAKHAAASRVGLTLSYMDDLVTLDVRDDGAGFEPDSVRRNGSSGGFGLTAMRQRVQGLAGKLEVESEPGGGTAISAAVPAIPAGGSVA
jgi:signal transduction histidine kinase